MKKKLLLFAMLVLPMLASADAVEINGIYYNLVSKIKEAEVTSSPGNYTGSVAIPEKITYEGVEYSVTSIGDRAFNGCLGLTSVTIPSSVYAIGKNAFGNCKALTSITIPNSVTTINSGAFFDCSSLTSVTVPNSVNVIGNSAFGNCKALTSITIPNSVTTINSGTFISCLGLTSVSIPSSVKVIGGNAFAFCKALTSITIPNSVTTINNGAFEECSSLTSITIGNGVRYIYNTAFAKCPELKDVYCLAETVPSITYSDAFDGSYIEYATLHVPDGSVSAYSNADPWKNFKSIVGLNGGGEAQKCATPTISYGGKKLTFACETEGVEYVSEIKDADVNNYYSSTIDLAATYEISVYATKSGYTNSDVATATLVWTSGSFTETTPAAGISSAPVYDVPVLIQSNQGVLTIECAADGTQVSVYGMDGTQIGSAAIQNGQACIATNLQSGSVAIVKVGQKAVKMIVK